MSRSSKSRNDDNNKKKNNSVKDEFPSAELMLTVIQKEYDYETMRKTRLETRVGILLTVTIAILTFLISNVKVPSDLAIDNNKTLFLFILGIIALVSAILFIILSLFYLINVFLVDEYKRLEINDFTRALGMYEKDKTAIAITERYRKIITHNHTKIIIKQKNIRPVPNVLLVQ